MAQGVNKAWFSLNRNSSPIIVLEHRRSSKTMIGDELRFNENQA